MARFPFFSFIQGLNTGVSPFLQPQSSLTVANGVNTSYKLGSILKDTGYSRVSTQIENNKSITGLFDFQQTGAIQRTFATVNDSTDDDTQLFAKEPAGAWSEIAAAETAWANKANINVEMEEFINYLFIVGHGATDGFITPSSVTGTTFSTSTNVTSMPNAKYIKKFRDRLYIANCDIAGTPYPYRVYFSSVPSAGAITWTVATDFFDVGYNLDVTGMTATSDLLYIFTRDQAFFYDQSQLRQIWHYGCSNHRTIQAFGPYAIWCTGDNIAITTGGQPQLIGGSVIDFIRGGTAQSFFSAQIDDEYYLYVGTVTVNGLTYTNCLLTYNFATDSWRSRELADDVTIMARYFDNTNWENRLYMGDADGNVWDKSKYTDTTIAQSDSETTLGTPVTPISSSFELTLPFGSMNSVNEVDNFVAYADRALGLKLKIRVLDRNARIIMPYTPIGELKQFVNTFNIEIEKGAIIQIQGSETGTNPHWSFHGFEIEVEDGGSILKGQ